MKSADTQTFIGFPPGLLCSSPLRTAVLHETDDWLAVDKPAGIAIRQHPWNTIKTDMDSALNKQLQAKKPELLKSNASLFGSVYSVEPEISGVALFAKHRDSLAKLRNLVGSEKFQFRFVFVAKADGKSELTADAPLLPHNTKPKMIPSTAKGKKARTHFKLLQTSPQGWGFWEARTAFPRLHQVRAHAAIQEIALLGDCLYSGAETPLLSEFASKKKLPGLQQPAFDGIPLHLSEVVLPAHSNNVETVRLVANLPKQFSLLLKRLQIYGSGDENNHKND